jgi:two-component system OmpR family sensor kinase/two-component system sensor histidine kinase QseC
MALHYSLKRRLIWYTSIFSILLGCVLIFSAYKIALQESNQILDAQMQYLAKRAATQPYGAVVSHFEKIVCIVKKIYLLIFGLIKIKVI